MPEFKYAAGGKIVSVNLNAKEKQAIKEEAYKTIRDFDLRNSREIDAMVLWVLHEKFRFKPDALRVFYDSFVPMIEALCSRYEMHDDGDAAWLCTYWLKRDLGIDLEQWEKEMKK